MRRPIKERRMSRVRVLVGTRKGAFVLTADAKREQWDVTGPHFGGWEIYHLKGSPVDPDRLYASQSSARATAAGRGRRWETISRTTAPPGPISGTTGRPTPGSSRGSGIWSPP